MIIFHLIFFFAEHIGTDFVLFLLNIIEDTPEADTTEMLPDFMISLLLSFNLQFEDFTNNIVLNAIRELNCAKNLTEKILLLLNREGIVIFMYLYFFKLFIIKTVIYAHLYDLF